MTLSEFSITFLKKGGEYAKDIHISESAERTGREFKELHEWVDDPSSKPERHDITKIYKHAKEIEDKWGSEGTQEFINHIQTDIRAQVSRIQEDIKNVLGYFGIKE